MRDGTLYYRSTASTGTRQRDFPTLNAHIAFLATCHIFVVIWYAASTLVSYTFYLINKT